ncbi:fructose transport system substrate-binding protein [Amaricoccus macauensis]|uniref:Fructose transport system substrate-binding protein n=1 Tax=Amaricoccus macauensis TaxID=57001 RepID=A0A840SPF5_9RHOB|nr:substrate-binding domain-containing protein [Amaricoccus macauensis]MBB5222630.1 fructose transport system substrate-binding protein [Amaricoccus macauensis]
MKLLLAGTAFALALGIGSGAMAAPISACLITKTDSNPFFTKMREGAVAKAKELGVELSIAAGKFDGDHESQVTAVEACLASGAKGILMVANDPSQIAPMMQDAQKQGILVIALDTPLSPADAADMTFATDNFVAGELIGQWAKEKLGDKAADARIAMLDALPSFPTIDQLRDQGFMKGFGIEINDPTIIGDETDPRIVGHEVTQGSEEGGVTAMEKLIATDPTINLVYTVNEPAAAGAYQALVSLGKDKDVTIVSVDGGCPGVKNVAEGALGATAQQYPLQMAALGIEAIAKFAETGEKPAATEGKTFFDTGVALVTDQPMPGVKSISTEEGLKLCWG